MGRKRNLDWRGDRCAGTPQGPQADPETLVKILGPADLGEGRHPHHTGEFDGTDKHGRFHEER